MVRRSAFHLASRGLRAGALLAVLLATLSGCARTPVDHQQVDIEEYSRCLRSGGQWWPREQFGGICMYQAPDKR